MGSSDSAGHSNFPQRPTFGDKPAVVSRNNSCSGARSTSISPSHTTTARLSSPSRRVTGVARDSTSEGIGSGGQDLARCIAPICSAKRSMHMNVRGWHHDLTPKTTWAKADAEWLAGSPGGSLDGRLFRMPVGFGRARASGTTRLTKADVNPGNHRPSESVWSPTASS